MVEVTDENFKDAVKQGTVVVDFYATWCNPCKMLASILEDVEKELPEVSIVKVDIETGEQTAAEHRVRGVPTLALYKDGSFVKSKAGVSTAAEIKSWIES